MSQFPSSKKNKKTKRVNSLTNHVFSILLICSFSVMAVENVSQNYFLIEMLSRGHHTQGLVCTVNYSMTDDVHTILHSTNLFVELINSNGIDPLWNKPKTLSRVLILCFQSFGCWMFYLQIRHASYCVS